MNSIYIYMYIKNEMKAFVTCDYTVTQPEDR